MNPKLLPFYVLMFACFATIAADKKERSLIDFLDERMLEITFKPLEFVEFSATTVELIRQRVLSMEFRPNAFEVGKQVECKIVAKREGKHGIQRTDGSIRDLLQECANMWNVVVILEKSKVTFTDKAPQATNTNEQTSTIIFNPRTKYNK